MILILLILKCSRAFSSLTNLLLLQPAGTVVSGTVLRISTGAPLPPGADAVVKVEDTRLVKSADEGRVEVEVEILDSPKKGQFIRYYSHAME